MNEFKQQLHTLNKDELLALTTIDIERRWIG